MEKTKKAVWILAAVLIFLGLSYAVIQSLKPKFAGLYVDSVPASYVFVDGKEVGKTPYRGISKPGEVSIKLAPDYFEKPLAPFESNIDLIAGVETVVKYNFAEKSDQAESEIITFERDERSQTGLIAVTEPESAILIVDNRERSFTPFKTTSLTPGDHTLRFVLDGYKEKTVKVKMHKGYKLTAFVKLAKSEQKTVTPAPPVITPVISTDTREKVEILTTPMGYLRVRKEATSDSDEIGRVSPGERYPLIENDAKSGWFQIEFVPETASQPAKLGWISNQYAKRLAQIGNTSPTLTPKPATPSGQLVTPTVGN